MGARGLDAIIPSYWNGPVLNASLNSYAITAIRGKTIGIRRTSIARLAARTEFRWRNGTFGITEIAVLSIPIITLLSGIDDAIATTWLAAVGSARICRDVAIACSVVAGFFTLDETVAAGGIGASIGASIIIGIIAVITGFAGVDYAIATTLKGTIGSAHGIGRIAIIVALVAVLITKPYQPIAAGGILTTARTGIGIYAIAIVALFVGTNDAIAAFKETAVIAAIAKGEIAIIAGLTRIELGITALKGAQSNGRLIATGERNGARHRLSVDH